MSSGFQFVHVSSQKHVSVSTVDGASSSHLTSSRGASYRILADSGRRIRTEDRLTILEMVGCEI